MHTFDTLKLTSFFWRNVHYSVSICSGATSTTDTMDIWLWVVWNMVVDHEVDIIEIESSTRDICSDKYTNMSVLKWLECLDTISLKHISVDESCGKPISKKISFELFCFVFSCSKNHYFCFRKTLKCFFEKWILISDAYSHKYVIDSIDGCCFRENKWLISSVNICIEHSCNFPSIGRGKCEHLFKSSELLPDIDYRLRKSHIHHLIDLIDNQCGNITKIDSSSFDHISESSWSRDDHLRTSPEAFDLFPDRRSTKDGERSHTHIARNIKNFITSLHREFTSWLEDKDLWCTFFSIHTIKCWNDKCSSFSRTCMGLDDDIFSCECKWNHLSLDFCWFMVAKDCKCRDNLRADIEGRKRHRKNGLNK